jgi:hypothetical protein
LKNKKKKKIESTCEKGQREGLDRLKKDKEDCQKQGV